MPRICDFCRYPVSECDCIEDDPAAPGKLGPPNVHTHMQPVEEDQNGMKDGDWGVQAVTHSQTLPGSPSRREGRA